MTQPSQSGGGERRVTEITKSFHLSRLGRRQKAELLAHPRVVIQSDNGFWRADCAGYTYFATAAEYAGAEAYAATNHCGREKQVRYHLLTPTTPHLGDVAPEKIAEGFD